MYSQSVYCYMTQFECLRVCVTVTSTGRSGRGEPPRPGRDAVFAGSGPRARGTILAFLAVLAAPVVLVAHGHRHPRLEPAAPFTGVTIPCS